MNTILSNSRHNISANLIANFLNQVLGIGFPILIQYYLIRHLSLEDIGYWNIINSSKSLVMLSLGYFHIYMIKQIANSKDEYIHGIYLTNTTILIYCISLLPITLYILYLLAEYDHLLIYIMISTISIFTAPLSMEYYFQASLKNDYLLYRRLAVRIIYILALLLFVKKESDFIWYACIASLSISLEHIINFWYLRNSIQIRYASKGVIRNIFRNSIGYLPFIITYNLLPQISIIVGGHFIGIQKIAIYSVIIKLINLATTFITSTIMVIFPYKIMNSSAREDVTFNNERYFGYTIIASLVVCFAMIIMRSIIFKIFLNEYSFRALELEYSILCFYIPIHSIYNYLAFTYYLVDGKSHIITLHNIGIVALFLIIMFSTNMYEIDVPLSVAVILPSLLFMIILLFQSVRSKNINLTKLFTL